jgi:IS30 family transposase
MTLVERQTRYVLLARLGHDRTRGRVAQSTKRRAAFPAVEITDRGQELVAHKGFSIQVYFCDPHSPWQRGSNENTNGLLRQYLPRKVDLAARSQLELDDIAAELNGRPRQTLEWQTPAEKMEALLR